MGSRWRLQHVQRHQVMRTSKTTSMHSQVRGSVEGRNRLPCAVMIECPCCQSSQGDGEHNIWQNEYVKLHFESKKAISETTMVCKTSLWICSADDSQSKDKVYLLQQVLHINDLVWKQVLYQNFNCVKRRKVTQDFVYFKKMPFALSNHNVQKPEERKS